MNLDTGMGVIASARPRPNAFILSHPILFGSWIYPCHICNCVEHEGIVEGGHSLVCLDEACDVILQCSHIRIERIGKHCGCEIWLCLSGWVGIVDRFGLRRLILFEKFCLVH